MAILTVQKASMTGRAVTYTPATLSGDEFANDGRTVLHVKNEGVSPITVTVNSQKPCDQGFDHDITVTVAASGEQVIGPLSTERFNNTSGRVEVTYSAVDSVTVAVIAI